MRVSGLDILVLAHFTSSTGRSNNRFNEICHTLGERGHDVELLTSSFDHGRKTQREVDVDADLPYSITLAQEPGYRRNVSVRRVLSHRTFGANVGEYLKKRKRPDVVYCAFPSDTVARAGLDYAHKVGSRFILDVQDLWPEAFELIINPPALGRLAFYPLRRSVESVYRKADQVVTVSETYSDRVRRVRENPDSVSTTYLGTNLGKFDQFPPNREHLSPEGINLAYIGTFGRSYDLPAVFDALRLMDEDDPKMTLHLMGSGPLEEQWRESTKDLGERVRFHGQLPYSEMVSRLRASDIALNPIVSDSAASIINKVGDYAAAGLPVINTQMSPEYRGLLRDYEAGLSTDGDAGRIAKALKALAADGGLRKAMGEGSRRMAEELFDRAVTYEKLADLVENGA